MKTYSPEAALACAKDAIRFNTELAELLQKMEDCTMSSSLRVLGDAIDCLVPRALAAQLTYLSSLTPYDPGDQPGEPEPGFRNGETDAWAAYWHLGHELSAQYAAAQARIANLQAQCDELDAFRRRAQEILMNDLHVFELGPDYVVARDIDDAWEVWREHSGENDMSYRKDLSGPLSADAPLTIWCDNDLISEIGEGKPTTRSCAEWAKMNGRGFLCSSEN